MNRQERGGRIEAMVECENALARGGGFSAIGFVDDRVSPLVLPRRFRGQLGEFAKDVLTTLTLGELGEFEGDQIGPLFVRIDGIRWMATEAFVPLSEDAIDLPIIGSIPLAQCPAFVDARSNRIVRRTHFDAKLAAT